MTNNSSLLIKRRVGVSIINSHTGICSTFLNLFKDLEINRCKELKITFKYHHSLIIPKTFLLYSVMLTS